MCNHGIKNHLNKLKFFADQIITSLNEEEMILFKDKAEVRSYKKGEVIYDCHDAHTGIYLIQKGSALLAKRAMDGDKKIFYTHAVGDLFGYRNLLNEDLHQEIAIVNDQLEVLYLDIKQVKELINIKGNFESLLNKAMNHDCLAMINRLNIITHKNIKVRIAYFLLLIGDSFHVDEHFFLKREDFASLIGTVRESFIRVLKKMNIEGLIELDKKEIKIKDYDSILTLINLKDEMVEDG